MGSTTPVSRKFDPLDLEMLDRVYALACLFIEARDLCGTRQKDVTEDAALRRLVFALAVTGPVDFDTLSDRVLASLATPQAM
jgi:hypothetical protein